MSADERHRLVELFLDDWLAAIDCYQQHIDHPENRMYRFATPLRFATEEVRRARSKDDRDGLVFALVFLAKMITEVHSALEDWRSAEIARLEDEEARHFDRLATAALRLADNETARLAALHEGRKTRHERQTSKLETVRPEFERLRAMGISRRRAAEILGPRYGLHPDTIRKRLK